MKKRKPKVIRYHPYFETIVKDNLIFTRDRDIHVKAKDEIKKFENKLERTNKKFIKKKLGEYYRYWIVF